MNNLFAAYTPGQTDLFGEGITPVNVLPILFNAYLDTDLPCHEDLSFASGAGNPLELHSLGKKSPGSNPACGQTTEQGYR